MHVSLRRALYRVPIWSGFVFVFWIKGKDQILNNTYSQSNMIGWLDLIRYLNTFFSVSFEQPMFKNCSKLTPGNPISLPLNNWANKIISVIWRLWQLWCKNAMPIWESGPQGGAITRDLKFCRMQKLYLKVLYVGLTPSGWTRYCSPNSKYWRRFFSPAPPPQIWRMRRMPD